jgi:hypothetical protein
MITFDKVGRMNLIGIFPSVVTFRVAFPFDQILQGLLAPVFPMSTDLFHFVLFFSID